MPHNRFLGFAKYSYKRLRSLVYENENNNNISDKATKNAYTLFSSKYLSKVHGLFPSKPTTATSSYKSALFNCKQAFNFACCWICQDNKRCQFRNRSNSRYLIALTEVFIR